MVYSRWNKLNWHYSNHSNNSCKHIKSINVAKLTVQNCAKNGTKTASTTCAHSIESKISVLIFSILNNNYRWYCNAYKRISYSLKHPSNTTNYHKCWHWLTVSAKAKRECCNWCYNNSNNKWVFPSQSMVKLSNQGRAQQVSNWINPHQKPNLQAIHFRIILFNILG